MSDKIFLETLEKKVINEIKIIINKFDKNQFFRFLIISNEDIFNPSFNYFKNNTRREILSSGFSFILFLLSQNKNKYNAKKIMNFNYINFIQKHNEKLEKLIQLLYKKYYINEYKLYVSNQNYKIELKNNLIQLKHPIKDFKYYYHMGYVRDRLEDLGIAKLSLESKNINHDEIMNMLKKEEFSKIMKVVNFELRDKGLKSESIIFGFSPMLLGGLSKLATKEFESRLFSMQQKYLDSSNIKLTDTLYDNTKLTWIDIAKLSIVFYYVSLYMTDVIEKYSTNERMTQNSKLLMMKKNELIDFMEDLLISINKDTTKDDTKKFISRFTTNLTQSNNGIYDIQFRPFIKFDSERYIVQFNTLGQVNLARAFIDNKFKEKENKDDNIILDDQGEKFENEILSLFEQKFDKDRIANSIKYKKNLEIDICLLGNKNIYFFECKNPTHPYSSNTSKSVYNYLNKGIKQLDEGTKYFLTNKVQFIKNHFRNIKIDNIDEYKIHKIIIMSTRNLSGLHFEDIIVRDFYSLRQTIEEGKIPISSIGNNESTSKMLWEKYTFSENDLINYISEKSIFFNELKYITEEITHLLDYDEYKLEISEYGINLEK